jgi:hypothetical protein
MITPPPIAMNGIEAATATGELVTNGTMNPSP